MAPKLLGQNCKFKFLLSLNPKKRLKYKENNSKYRSLTRKPQIHVRIYQTWPIRELSPIFILSRNLYDLWTLRIYSNLYVFSAYSTVHKECKWISPKFAFCLHEFSRIFQAKLRDFAASPFEEILLCRMKIHLQPRKFTHLQTIFQSEFVNSRTKIQIAYRKLLILKEVSFGCNNWRNLLQTKTLFWNCTIVNSLLVWYYNMQVSARSELNGGFKSSHKNTALWKQ